LGKTLAENHSGQLLIEKGVQRFEGHPLPIEAGHQNRDSNFLAPKFMVVQIHICIRMKMKESFCRFRIQPQSEATPKSRFRVAHP
jgi:hypothetical protein